MMPHTTTPVRIYRKRAVTVSRYCAVAAVLLPVASGYAVAKGWLTFNSKALPLLTALLVVLTVLVFVFGLRGDRIDQDYSVAEDVDPPADVDITVDDVIGLLRPLDRAGEGQAAPLALERGPR